MRKIPKTAKKTADYIRKTVKRPKRLPKPDEMDFLRWGRKCPLGMLKEAGKYEPTPSELENFKTRPDELTNTDIKSFWKWWDDLDVSDALEAMNAVWGKKK